VTRSSLGERAYEELRSAIVTQRLSRGTPLVEADVTASLGVSRTPVREALRRLELEGYLERDRSSRLFVRRMTVEQLDEVFLVRELLEAFAARLAADRIADSELERLDGLLAADLAALEDGDDEELARLNEQIHGVVLEASRNRTLSQVLRTLRGRVFGLTAFAVGSRDDQRAFVEEHRQLVRLLADGDGEAAEALVRRHLRRARDVLAAGLTAAADAAHDSGRVAGRDER
jgi:DNA-binding GntR family transcriptional regulator